MLEKLNDRASVKVEEHKLILACYFRLRQMLIDKLIERQRQLGSTEGRRREFLSEDTNLGVGLSGVESECDNGFPLFCSIWKQRRSQDVAPTAHFEGRPTNLVPVHRPAKYKKEENKKVVLRVRKKGRRSTSEERGLDR